MSPHGVEWVAERTNMVGSRRRDGFGILQVKPRPPRPGRFMIPAVVTAYQLNFLIMQNRDGSLNDSRDFLQGTAFFAHRSWQRPRWGESMPVIRWTHSSLEAEKGM